MATKARGVRAQTTREGTLNLSVDVGISDADVAVDVHVQTLPAPAAQDGNGWPVGYFDQVVGSMPDLRRGSQGRFEERLALD